MAELMGRTNGSFGLPFFVAFVRSDPKEPARNVLRLGQGGLGLNGRDYYLDEKFKSQKQAYEAYAARTLNKRSRTTPLRGLWQHAPYFHDGSAKTLRDVVEHYNRVRNLGLSGGQKRDLVEYLKSL